jgi:hypothetical protein
VNCIIRVDDVFVSHENNSMGCGVCIDLSGGMGSRDILFNRTWAHS